MILLNLLHKITPELSDENICIKRLILKMTHLLYAVTLANWQKFSKVRSLLDLLRRIIPELSFENSHTLYFSHTLSFENTMYENTMYDLLRQITRELSFESTMYASFNALKI